MTREEPSFRWGWWGVTLICLIGAGFWWQDHMPDILSGNPQLVLSGVGHLLGIVGFALFAIAFLLNTRWRWVEDLFGGLNQVYIAHHTVGGLSFIFLLLHPVLLGLSRLYVSPSFAGQLFVPFLNAPITFGQLALLTMQVILIITFFAHLAYQKWKFIHQWMGLAFALGVTHAIWQSLDAGRVEGLTWYLAILSVIALTAYSYRTLLGRWLVEKYPYRISRVERLNKNILEIELHSQSDKVDYRPAQFVFVSFPGSPVGAEFHPFSITSIGPNLTLGVKVSGDFTQKLYKQLEAGGRALIERPYGRFSEKWMPRSAGSVWIAGGIGITPFVSMAKALTTQDGPIHLLYSVKQEDDLVYKDVFDSVAAKHKNFTWELRVSDEQGKVTVEDVAELTDDITKTEFFVCGPTSMMKMLSQGLKKLGVRRRHIHTEIFELA